MESHSTRKTHALYSFFLKEGFNHTVEEIAKALHVTPKTLFNRYQTKGNMELSARRYWHQQIQQRLMAKAAYCNNAVEKLVLLLCECEACIRLETSYFQKEAAQFFSMEENAFNLCLHQFIEEGQREQLLNPAVNQEEYAVFFLHNLFFFFPQHLQAESFYHILSPLFLPESHHIYNQIDINHIIHQ